MNHWTETALVYHLYPLGALGAPWTNSGTEPVSRIRELTRWIEPARRVGANTLLLGPLWESGTHGYDTHDYSTLDRRLGTNADLEEALAVWKAAGFRILLDGVFNHCGRGFAPFADLVRKGRDSAFPSWFTGVDFTQRSPLGDPFAYEGWNGHLSLPKFHLANPETRNYLFTVVADWIDRYQIDGLRLDAADVMDRTFLRDLAASAKARKRDFWLMGEVIHGDYNLWSPGAGLDSVTNYELFKGLWSSHNDGNYFEAAWTLDRQFGPDGIYQGQRFATFGDNHDVDRLASTLDDPRHLYPHAILTATVPGIPTLYYGTEAGLEGKKGPAGDEGLRPALEPEDLDHLPHQPLRALWARLAAIRHQEPALRTGGYRQEWVTHRQLAYWRTSSSGAHPVAVAVNSAWEPVPMTLRLPPDLGDGPWVDLLNPEEPIQARGGVLEVTLWPCWGRILVPGSTN